MSSNTFDEIKKIVFACKIGECPSLPQWQRFYAEGGKNLPLEHLTSCVSCLDIVNNLLGLPLLNERHPFDTIARDSGNDDPFNSAMSDENTSSGGTKAKGANSGLLLQRLEQARQQHFLHPPQELTLCVNGWPFTSQQVQAGANTLIVRPPLDQPLENVELIDENGKLLYHLPLTEDYAEGNDGQWRNISLSSDQKITLTLTWLDEYPEINLQYCDQRVKAISIKEDRANFWQRLLNWQPWLPRLVFTTAVLLVILLPMVILWRENSAQQTIAQWQQKVIVVEQQKDELSAKLANEQSHRQALENEIAILKQTTPKEPDKTTEMVASLGLQLYPGRDDMDAILVSNTRSPLTKPIILARKKSARLAVRLARYDEDGQTIFNTYLIKLSLPGRKPLSARLKTPTASSDEAFVVLESEFVDTDKLAPDTTAQATFFGIVKDRQVSLGTITLQFK